MVCKRVDVYYLKTLYYFCFFRSNNIKTHEKIVISFITFMKKSDIKWQQNFKTINFNIVSISLFVLFNEKWLNLENYKLDRSPTKPKKKICTKDYVKYQKIWFICLAEIFCGSNKNGGWRLFFFKCPCISYIKSRSVWGRFW